MRARCVAVLALAASTAAAQSLTGVIAGTVRDPQGLALPGATVSLEGRAGTSHTTTEADGNYRFSAVEPGTYSVRAESPGFRAQRRERIAIHAGVQLTVDFLLGVGSVADSLEVVAESPLVEVRSSGFRIGLTQDQLFNLPLVRDVQQLQDALPGINGSLGYPGNGGTWSSAFGAVGNGNAIYLDGVDTRDPRDGTPLVLINYNLLDEVQIEGPGAPAEYGAYTGAVINAVTRSGGNRFAGLFEARYSGSGLGSDNVGPALLSQNPSLGHPAVTTRLLDLTGQVSGPIRRDSLFFLLNAQRSAVDTKPSGPITSERERAERWNGKLTWEPGSQDHVALSFQRDTKDAFNIAGANDIDATTTNRFRSEWVWSLQWRRLFGARTFLDARYLGWTKTHRNMPQADVPGHIDLVTGQKSGSAGWRLLSDLRRHQASVSVSHYAEAFGRHDLKFGLEIERGRGRDRFGSLIYFDSAGQPYLVDSYGFDVTGGTHRESVYAQDGWRPTERVTLNLGARLDLYRGKNEGGGTVYDARGLAPRLGLAWELGGDHRAVARVSFARYYESLPVYYFFPALSGFQDEVFYANTSAGLVEIERQHQGAAAVDPGIRHPRVDELAVGFEHALGKGIRLSLAGILRHSGNFFHDFHPGARFERVTIANPLTGQPMTVYPLANPSVLQEPAFITNVDGFRYLDTQGELIGTARAFRRYRALMVVASRRLEGRWQVQASYVLSKAEGTVDNTYDSGLGPLRVGVEQFGSANFTLVNFEGLLTNDFRHELKLLGSYRVPRVELGLNAFYRLVSGTTYTPLLQRGLGAGGDLINSVVPLEPRGSRRLPAHSVLDLRIEKTLGVGRGRFGLYVDVSNVFNASTATAAQDRVPSLSIYGYDQPVPFGAPLAILPPRQTTLGARWSF